MLTLLILIIFSVGVAYFSTQNTQNVSIAFDQYTVASIPLYLVVLASLFLGIFISLIISLVGSISSSLTLHGKESKIKEAQRRAAELTKQVHQLELENERLKAQSGETTTDDKSL